MLRVWAAATGECLAAAAAYPAGSPQLLLRVAVSGGRVVGGSFSSVSAGCEVRVWALDSLRPERALAQPGGADVRFLLAWGDEVWAGVGDEVVVWGR